MTRSKREYLSSIRTHNRRTGYIVVSVYLPVLAVLWGVEYFATPRWSDAMIGIISISAQITITALVGVAILFFPAFYRKRVTILIGLIGFGSLVAQICELSLRTPDSGMLVAFLASYACVVMVYALPRNVAIVMYLATTLASASLIFSDHYGASEMGIPLIAIFAWSMMWVRTRENVIHQGLELRHKNMSLNLQLKVSRNTRDALEDSNRRYKTVLSAMAEGVVLQDDAGRIISCNRSAEIILGQELDVLRNRTSFDVYNSAIHEGGDTFQSEDQPAMIALRSGRSTRNVVMGLYDPSGNLKWLSVNAEPIVRPDENRPHMVVTSFHDITERKKTDDLIKSQALHDDLTGLANRTLLAEKLALELAHARRDSRKLAVLFCDLDRFKQVNDTLGHSAGDWLLQQVAVRMRGCVRASDTLARQGGDEFILLLPGLRDGEAAGRVARKILDALSAPFLYGDHELRIGCSIGIAMFPDNGAEQSMLLRHADMAMYAAKLAEGSAYRYYSDVRPHEYCQTNLSGRV